MQICSKFTFPRLSIFLPFREREREKTGNVTSVCREEQSFYSWTRFDSPFLFFLNVLSGMKLFFSCFHVNKCEGTSLWFIDHVCYVTTSTEAECFNPKGTTKSTAMHSGTLNCCCCFFYPCPCQITRHQAGSLWTEEKTTIDYYHYYYVKTLNLAKRFFLSFLCNNHEDCVIIIIINISGISASE